MTGARGLDAREARAWLDAHVNLETGVGVPARARIAGEWAAACSRWNASAR